MEMSTRASSRLGAYRSGYDVLKIVLLSSSLLSLPVSARTVDRAVSDPLEEYRARAEVATPQSVLAWLREGNARFVQGKSSHGGYPTDSRERIRVSSAGQRPLAAVLSCIDSRTTPELAFDTSVGDVFTARVGANVVNDDILGSLEIAVESGARVVVVLGHTDCGGIKAACSDLDFGHMTQLLQRIKPAIAATGEMLDHDPDLARTVGERTVQNRRYIAEVSHSNVRASVAQILERSPILRAHVEKGTILLVPALFHVETGAVGFDEPVGLSPVRGHRVRRN